MSGQFCPYCMKELSGSENICPACGCEVHMTAQPHQLPIGTVLMSRNGHKFLFGMVKGEGGFGMTYIGKELASGRLVAVKEYFPFRCQPQRLPDGSVQPQERFREIYDHGMQSFLSEASMLRAVGRIPSIVHVMDYFEADQTAYMVMEYLDGATLYQVMQSQERVAPDALLQKFLPLMYDLSELHGAGVLHRDIAPDNIMLMPDGTLKLLDFGCARSLEDGRSMTVVLKPGFAPIEQYQTRGQSAATDIYALCATIYYCLTGSVPPASPERLTAVFDNKPDPLQPPSALGAAITSEQEQILMWGLSLQPTVRPREIRELASRLEKVLVQKTGQGYARTGQQMEQTGQGIGQPGQDVRQSGQPTTVQGSGQLAGGPAGRSAGQDTGRPEVQGPGQPTIQDMGQPTWQEPGQPTVQGMGQPAGQPTVQGLGRPTAYAGQSAGQQPGMQGAYGNNKKPSNRLLLVLCGIGAFCIILLLIYLWI